MGTNLEAITNLRKAVGSTEADQFANGSVIRWKRRYETPSRGGRRNYTYAALRANGRWFVTGPMAANRSGISYESLVKLLAAEGVTKIAVATGWSSLEDGPTTAKMAAAPIK